MVEYPGYGIYKEKKTTENGLYSDAIKVYQFLINTLDFKPDQIIVLGRSLGSGPAIFLASRRHIGALILISPFYSLQAVAKNLGGYFAFLLPDIFRNYIHISKV